MESIITAQSIFQGTTRPKTRSRLTTRLLFHTGDLNDTKRESFKEEKEKNCSHIGGTGEFLAGDRRRGGEEERQRKEKQHLRRT